jgi:hypothetical protein
MRMRTNISLSWQTLTTISKHYRSGRIPIWPGWGWYQAETQTRVAKMKMMCGANFHPCLKLLQYSMSGSGDTIR